MVALTTRATLATLHLCGVGYRQTLNRWQAVAGTAWVNPMSKPTMRAVRFTAQPAGPAVP